MGVRRALARGSRWSLVALAGLLVLFTLALCGFRVAAAAREIRSRTEVAPATGRFVRAADVDVFVQEEGPADGPPVVLIHGTGAWGAIWAETMHALAGAGFRAIALDMPPFGFSERPAGAAYDDGAQARRIIGVLGAMGLSGVTLVGHSFGGRPTMAAYFLAPDRVRALVLVDVALGLQAPAAGTAAPLLARSALAVGPIRDALVSATLTNPLLTRTLLARLIHDPARATDSVVRMLQRPFPVRASTAALGAWLVPFVTATDPSPATTRSNYERIAIPCLVVWGAEDTITPLAQGEDLARLIPGARLVVLTQTGHIPAIENATGLNEALLSFLPRSVTP